MNLGLFSDLVSARRFAGASVVLACMSAGAGDRVSPPSAAELMGQVVRNELADRAQQRKWIYRINKQDGIHVLSETQVDTIDGPFYRLLAIDGKPLDPGQRNQDDARMDRLLHDPGQQLKAKRGHDEDEQKLEKLLRLMSATFLYDYDGLEGTLIRLKFRPNPDYDPPTYEARLANNMAGTILIDPQQKRLARFTGQLIHRVEFGYGFLGHIDQGGTMEIGRVQVGPSEWKTAQVKIQMTGRLVLFKTVNKQQFETRSDFRAVSGDINLAEATKLLNASEAHAPKY